MELQRRSLRHLLISINMDAKEKTYDELKAEIDQLSHFQMCYMWRTGKANPAYFNKANPISEYFTSRLYNHFGGFTPEISKQIGW